MTTIQRPDTSKLLQGITTKDAQNRFLLKGLFRETSETKRKFPTRLTLQESDHQDGHISIHRLYVQYCDPSEYVFAIAVLGSFEHWQKLKGCSWFQPYYAKMRIALEQSMKSTAQTVIMDMAFNDQDYRAVKSVHDGSLFKDSISDTGLEELAGYDKDPLVKASVIKKAPSKRTGRPSKEELKSALDEDKRQAKEAEDALKLAQESIAKEKERYT